ncbi:pentatricopeptide repeat-containing protein [Tanacetum coccineum]
MPQVIAHTAVIQAYADAGKPKDALKVFERMLACGVLPNAYTYSVLVNCLAGSGEWKMVKEGVKWFCEMMGKGIRPNAETCVALFEGVVKCSKMEEGRELVRKMKGFGFQVDEKGVREVIKGAHDKRRQELMCQLLIGERVTSLSPQELTNHLLTNQELTHQLLSPPYHVPRRHILEIFKSSEIYQVFVTSGDAK